MTMKTNKIFFVALLAASMLSACSFLDSDNKSTVTADEQFSTETGWNQLLNQAYFSLRKVYANPMLFCAGTDMYTVAQGNAKSPLHIYSFNADNKEVEDLYTSTYAAINAANCVIKYSSNDKLNDEARFIRNIGYYVLTQQFGSIPYITAYIESAESSYPRTELAEIYKGMIADMEDVINQNRLDPLPSNCAGHANIAACKALLAKIYLAAAWDLHTTLTDAANGTYTVSEKTYFEKAGALADTVAQLVPLSLSFADKWDFDLNENGANPENLFAVQYDRATSADQSTGGHSMQHYFGGYMGSQSLGVKALKNDLCPTERVHYAFEKGDDRYEASFMTTVYAWNGNEADWAKSSYWGFWNATAAELKNTPISWHFFPWYTEDAEVTAYQAEHAAQFVTDGYKQPTKLVRVADQLQCWAYAKNGSEDAATSAANSMQFVAAIGKIGLVPPIKKFDDKKTDPTVAQSNGDYRDVILLNASEIYLTGAEAYLMAEQSGKALNLLNQVRQRAHASNLTSFSDYKRYDWAQDPAQYVSLGGRDAAGLTINELDVILDERMRETVGEMNRWMDLRRTKQLVRYNIAYNELTEAMMTGIGGKIKWLRPIPTNEMQINTGIKEQNPGF